MDILKQHEIFEIEVLNKMNSAKMLEPVVFGGGTMLRLCHELSRYSANLDFWFIKKTRPDTFLERLNDGFSKEYEITDSHVKLNTILLEFRSARYPKRLKIEIRKEMKACDFQEKIAFSRFSTTQVILRAHTLEQTMRNKVAAFLDRQEIRDCFDIEFLLRRGIAFPKLDIGKRAVFQKKLAGLKEIDFKVKLGSIVNGKTRAYYIANKFSYLVETLNSMGNKFDIVS